MIFYALLASTIMVSLAMILTMIRLLRGPSVLDRVLALDTLYVNAVALLLLMGLWDQSSVYFEAAMLIALMGFVGTVALCKYILRRNVIE
ncbi:MAG: K+/H+ antiporter subunit F [Spirochaetales bacterium]|nr:K+/H+ antiporter subunit F [Spirochaetales bacterium]